MPKPLWTYPKLKQLWVSMRGRCNTRSSGSYHRYGAQGIKICPEWDDYKVFEKWAEENGYKQGLSLDRIDNNKGYSPDNCRWITRKGQLRNRTNNKLLTAFGETKCLSEWVEDDRCTVNFNTLWKRLWRAWDTEAAITQPQGSKR